MSNAKLSDALASGDLDDVPAVLFETKRTDSLIKRLQRHPASSSKHVVVVTLNPDTRIRKVDASAGGIRAFFEKHRGAFLGIPRQHDPATFVLDVAFELSREYPYVVVGRDGDNEWIAAPSLAFTVREDDGTTLSQRMEVCRRHFEGVLTDWKRTHLVPFLQNRHTNISYDKQLFVDRLSFAEEKRGPIRQDEAELFVRRTTPDEAKTFSSEFRGHPCVRMRPRSDPATPDEPLSIVLMCTPPRSVTGVPVALLVQAFQGAVEEIVRTVTPLNTDGEDADWKTWNAMPLLPAVLCEPGVGYAELKHHGVRTC